MEQFRQRSRRHSFPIIGITVIGPAGRDYRLSAEPTVLDTASSRVRASIQINPPNMQCCINLNLARKLV